MPLIVSGRECFRDLNRLELRGGLRIPRRAKQRDKVVEARNQSDALFFFVPSATRTRHPVTRTLIYIFGHIEAAKIIINVRKRLRDFITSFRHLTSLIQMTLVEKFQQTRSSFSYLSGDFNASSLTFSIFSEKFFNKQ